MSAVSDQKTSSNFYTGRKSSVPGPLSKVMQADGETRTETVKSGCVTNILLLVSLTTSPLYGHCLSVPVQLGLVARSRRPDRNMISGGINGHPSCNFSLSLSFSDLLDLSAINNTRFPSLESCSMKKSNI